MSNEKKPGGLGRLFGRRDDAPAETPSPDTVSPSEGTPD